MVAIASLDQTEPPLGALTANISCWGEVSNKADRKLINGGEN